MLWENSFHVPNIAITPLWVHRLLFSLVGHNLIDHINSRQLQLH